jgi:RNase adapter protein RapZ
MRISKKKTGIKQKNIIIITGCSGSGKTTALDTFEDAGFYCIDNMPVNLVADFLKQDRDNSENIAGWAFVMDLRDRKFLVAYPRLRDHLIKNGYHVTIVFLDADEQVLIRRYSQTRRRHPLASGGSLLTTIRNEKTMIGPLRKDAHHIIDTTHYSVHELKFAVLNIAQKHTAISGMAVNVVSFGFKHGTPPDADLIMDVRFLSNPYFVPELKLLNGETAEVRAFVLNDPETVAFLKKYLDLIDYLIPRYEKEGKAYLTIAIGCTGGMHRSVVIAQKVYEHILSRQSEVGLIHRDI